MRSVRILLASAFVFAMAVPGYAYNHARRGPTAPNLSKRRSSSRPGNRSSGKSSGPRAIDSERATQIQEALIKGGYLTGAPSGHWDAESQAAMQKLQGSQGWQTKLTPDSRALIMLGLGPNGGRDSLSNVQPVAEAGVPKEDSSLSSSAGAHMESTFAAQQ